MSVVRIGLAARAPGLSRVAAQRYWRGVHASLFSRLPGLLSYVQNHAVLDDRGEPLYGDPGFDIFAEVEFGDEATLGQVTSSPYYRDVILADEEKLLDATRRTFLMTHRRVIVGQPRTGLPKVVLFLGQRSAPELDEAVIDDWLAEAGVHAARAIATSVNAVHRVGGPIALPVAVVLQSYFEKLDDARDWYVQTRRRWASASSDKMTIIAAVIASELEIVPRASTVPCAEVRP